MMRDRDRQPLTPPVKVGDELDVNIEAIGEKGDGIARKQGFVLFVPGVKEGDNVKIRITRVLRKVGFAEVIGAGTPGEASQQEAPAAEAPAEGQSEESSQEPSEEPSEQDSESFGEE